MSGMANRRACWLISAAAAVFTFFAIEKLTAAERGHGAHVHGVSRLTLAVEGDRVELGLEAPGADIAGFEHMARSAEDRETVQRASRNLRNGDKLFAFPAAAQCRLQAAEVESPLSAGEHDRDKGHAEFHALYRFQCGRPDALTHVDARNFFKRFPAAREIAALAITPKGQRAGELIPSAPKLAF